MKKLVLISMAIAMLIPFAVLAEDTVLAAPSATTANAVVESANTYDVIAPYAGVVAPFSWERGDRVTAKDALFTLDTQKVYAPATGTLRGLFVSEGELCEDAVAQYGMIAGIEKTRPLMLDADTKGAYDSEENKIIHLGEIVYFEETKDSDNEGEGRIIRVNGGEYDVEVTAGDFDPDDTVKIYRDEKMGTKTCIGQGTVKRGEDVKVSGSGRVLKSYYREGQQVRKGQLLFELISADAEPEVSSAQVLAGYDGVLDEPAVRSGQQVAKGQALVTIHDLSALQVVAEVDEVDLDRVHVGDSLAVIFDRYPGMQVSGSVRSIAGLGKEKQNATYYNVEIAFTTSMEVLPGMNATVYLPNGN